VFAVEDRHFWFGARNLAIKTVIDGFSSRLPSAHRVLEIGCGTGNTLRVLNQACPDASILVGIDLFEEGLMYARRRTKLPLVRARIEHAPFAVPFDVVGMFDVLEHIADDAAALRVVRSLTKPGGYLVLTVPAHMSLWGRFDEESHHCRRYEGDELRARLLDAGFTVDYLTPFMAALYPMARIARSLSDAGNRLRRRLNMTQTSAVLRDLTVTPVVNELAGFVLRQEAHLLRRRIKLPIGTSLLAVARVSS